VLTAVPFAAHEPDFQPAGASPPARPIVTALPDMVLPASWQERASADPVTQHPRAPHRSRGMDSIRSSINFGGGKVQCPSFPFDQVILVSRAVALA
jgi:hypothetical protein